MRLFLIISAVFVSCISLVLGLTGVLYAHTRQAPPCFAGNPTPSTSVSPAPSTPGVIFINEVLPLPLSNWDCAVQSPAAWIELYNASDQAFDLYSPNIFITDSKDHLYFFPPGAMIAPHGFYVAFQLGSTTSSIALTGTELYLSVNNIVVDSVSLPTSFPFDQSYARMPDGGPHWLIATTPTIGSSNVVVTQTATPTPKAAKGTSKQSSSGSKKTGSTRSSNSQAASSSGASSHTGQNARQPSWKAMQLPGTATPAAASTPAKNNTSTLPGAILLAASSLALILALAWCWKLFKPGWPRLH